MNTVNNEDRKRKAAAIVGTIAAIIGTMTGVLVGAAHVGIDDVDDKDIIGTLQEETQPPTTPSDLSIQRTPTARTFHGKRPLVNTCQNRRCGERSLSMKHCKKQEETQPSTTPSDASTERTPTAMTSQGKRPLGNTCQNRRCRQRSLSMKHHKKQEETQPPKTPIDTSTQRTPTARTSHGKRPLDN